MAPQDEEIAKAREMADREYARLWRAWRTVHEMVQDRVRCLKSQNHCRIRSFTNKYFKGYELAEEEVRISLEDFRAQYSGVDGPE